MCVGMWFWLGLLGCNYLRFCRCMLDRIEGILYLVLGCSYGGIGVVSSLF